jgi:Raf kinase inhibitor-like YbhB/YbcL family protein
MPRPAAPQLLVFALALATTGSRKEGDRMAFSLSSTAFQDGSAIPVKHTCDGADVSPPLAWSGAPSRAAAYALIADDPDAPAGTWVHWVLYNLPGTTTHLPENVAKTDAVPDLGGALQGRNDFRRAGYGGPCPPPGPAHRYFFKLYALDAPLKLKPGAQKQDVEAAMQAHVLGTAQLVGAYGRQRR